MSDQSSSSDQVTPGERPEEKEKWIHLAFTWSGKSFTLDIAESDRSERPDDILGADGSDTDIGIVTYTGFSISRPLYGN